MKPDRVTQLLCDLVAIPSVNPTYDPASSGEGAVAAYVEQWATALGLTVRRDTVLPGRENVVMRLEGPEGAPTLLLEAHMDTVGVVGMAAPFAPVVRDGAVFGRGACDTKGSLAAMMAAVEALAGERAALSCHVELLAAVDEETSGKGARAHVAAGHRADAAIVGEPTGLRVVHRHNGCVRGEVVVTGRAAHTSVAGEGINAIEAMAEVIRAMRDLNTSLATGPGGAEANGSLTVSLITGGAGINIVPETCAIQYDRRTTPGQTATQALAEIDAALDTVRAARPDVGIARLEPWLVGATLDTPAEASIVQLALASAAGLGLDETAAWVPYGSDASKLAAGGIPTIVLGPGDIAHAHAIDERVPIADLAAAAALYASVARGFGTSAA